MSYDLFFFQLKENVTVKEINDFLESEEISAYREKRGDDEPLLPARFMNTALSEDALRGMLGKAYLRLSVPEAERTESLIRFLESDANEPQTGDDEEFEEWQDDMEMTFEYAAVGGMVPLMFSYGGRLDEAFQLVVDMLCDLETQRIAVYDPQLEKVIDATNLEEVFEAGDEDEEDLEEEER